MTTRDEDGTLTTPEGHVIKQGKCLCILTIGCSQHDDEETRLLLTTFRNELLRGLHPGSSTEDAPATLRRASLVARIGKVLGSAATAAVASEPVENFLIRVANESFRCPCGANVFRRNPAREGDRYYLCNGCNAPWIGEQAPGEMACLGSTTVGEKATSSDSKPIEPTGKNHCGNDLTCDRDAYAFERCDCSCGSRCGPWNEYRDRLSAWQQRQRTDEDDAAQGRGAVFREMVKTKAEERS